MEYQLTLRPLPKHYTFTHVFTVQYSEPVYIFFESEIFALLLIVMPQKYWWAANSVGPDQTARYAPFDQAHTGRIRTTIVVTSGLRVK